MVKQILEENSNDANSSKCYIFLQSNILEITKKNVYEKFRHI